MVPMMALPQLLHIPVDDNNDDNDDDDNNDDELNDDE